uniref:S-methyl-5'-thioadenosine phosphorylase n=1 Tax=Branchiostoma floridae TaxID=7739 RepID=C3Y9W3_BRAFL|eukprot:XP_002606862.1 hypothetical protein BRAFLDRAFT_91631 [Branchiostoma floridae]
MFQIGIIGGSGLDNPDILDNRREKHVDTPYGKPSDALILGDVGGVECVLLAREDIHPGDMVILDQFIDRTTKRATTFYDGNPGSPLGVCHLPMDTPFCPHTRKILIDVCKELEIRHHESGTMVTIEGPRFSSRAESKMFRMWGGDVINMTTVPEVALAKEAGMCYAAVAMATDYDCWRDDPGHHVSVEAVLKVFKGNAEKGVRIFKSAIPKIAQRDWSAVLEENRVTVSSSIMLPPSEG